MPNNNSWTAGHWRVEQDTTLVWGNCNPDDTSSRGMGYPITECRITPVSLWAKGPDAGEGEANARLIAAAPDMAASMYPEILEAAAALLLECEKYETARSLLHVAEEQRAALSKARGE